MSDDKIVPFAKKADRQQKKVFLKMVDGEPVLVTDVDKLSPAEREAYFEEGVDVRKPQ